MQEAGTHFEELWRKAQVYVRSIIDSKGKNNLAESARRSTDQAKQNYRGRFLYELIQNAYDAHDLGARDGRVAVVVRSAEESHGVLYVANTGNPFTKRNVEKVATFAASDKTIGQSIGNKGVGFTSVLQVCRTPEIFSSASSREPTQPGYRFRFATPDDLAALLDGDAVAAADIANEFPYSQLVVPLADTPPAVAALHAAGYVTVIRLPLRSDGALAEVLQRVEELCSETTPTLLFLDRLASVNIDVDGPFNPSLDPNLVRHGEPFELEGLSSAETVDLGSLGDFVVMSADVDPARLRPVIADAVGDEELDPRWSKLADAAAVAVAVHLAEVPAHGRLYTFLPFGQGAHSPCAAFLNAPFFADFARRNLDAEHKLNDFLLDVVAETCITAAQSLTHQTDAWCDAAIIDLISWQRDDIERLDQACARVTGAHLTDLPVVPKLGVGNAPRAWGAPNTCTFWQLDKPRYLSVERLRDHAGADLVDESRLGDDRLRALAGFYETLDVRTKPTRTMAADWVEAVAATIKRTDRGLSEWQDFYADLPRVFKSSESLEGRRIILSDNWDLEKANSWAPAAAGGRRRLDGGAFFSPTLVAVDEGDETLEAETEIRPPSRLRESMYFVNSRLEWTTDQDGRKARAFLGPPNGLVRRFDTRSLLEHLESRVPKLRSPRAHDEVLRFAFAIHRAKPHANADAFGRLGALVPTALGEWIPAGNAVFSSGWQGTKGASIEGLVTEASGLSPEFARLQSQLLAHSDAVCREGESTQAWVHFLRLLGVRDQLPIISVRDSRKVLGRKLGRDWLGSLEEVPEAVRDSWTSSVQDRATVHRPESYFQAVTDITWVCGQSAYEQFPDKLKRAYSELLLHSLGDFDDGSFKVQWRTENSPHVFAEVASPMATFLREVPWVPSRLPDQRVVFARLQDVWIPGGSDLQMPAFLQRPSDRFMTDASVRSETHDRLVELGANVWGGDGVSMVRSLGELSRSMNPGTVQSAAFRDAYASAWSIAESQQPDAVFGEREGHLVVRRGSTTSGESVEALRSDQSELFVVSERDNALAAESLRLLRKALVNVQGSDVAAVAQRLRVEVSPAAKAASGLRIDVQCDGGAPETLPSINLLDLTPALPVLVCAALAHHGSSFVRRKASTLDRIVDLLWATKLVTCQEITITVDGNSQPLPVAAGGVVAIHGDRPTLALAGDLPNTWEGFEILVDPLLELLQATEIGADIKLALVRLSRATLLGSSLTPDDIAAALGLHPDDVEKVESDVAGSIDPLVRRVIPIVATANPEDAAVRDVLEGRDVVPDLDRLHELGAEALGDHPDIEFGRVMDLARELSNLDDLRKACGISLADLNDVLARSTLGNPISYELEHQAEFARRIQHRRHELQDQVRWSRIDELSAHTPQNDWNGLITLAFLGADEEWNTERDELTPQLIDHRIGEQMAVAFGDRYSISGPVLLSVDDLRQRNTQLVRELIHQLRPVVETWTRKNDHPLPPWWNDDQSKANSKLVSAGSYDLGLLKLDDLIEWLAGIGAWPESMPHTADLPVLRLGQGDIESYTSEEAKQKEEQRRAERTIDFEGHELDLADEANALLELINSSLNGNPGVLETKPQVGLPNAIKRRGEKPGRGERKGSTTDPALRMTDRQRNGIGRLGEYVAYRWLEKHYPGDVTEGSWVSRNRVFALDGGEGDDSLGYDFAFGHGRSKLMFEVKASIADTDQIELGESEVRTAQQNAKTGSWRILLVERVTGADRRITVLPNPFHVSSQGRYEFVGHGLRLRIGPRSPETASNES